MNKQVFLRLAVFCFLFFAIFALGTQDLKCLRFIECEWVHVGCVVLSSRRSNGKLRVPFILSEGESSCFCGGLWRRVCVRVTHSYAPKNVSCL